MPRISNPSFFSALAAFSLPSSWIMRSRSWSCMRKSTCSDMLGGALHDLAELVEGLHLAQRVAVLLLLDHLDQLADEGQVLVAHVLRRREDEEDERHRLLVDGIE